MGHTKRRSARPAQQVRPRTTRSKGRPLTDVGENTQQLTEQLRGLGLYAAPTLGDGNCLFRALSDQLYGTDTYHLKLRHALCNWIEAHKERYAPFVDDDRGLDVHLQCMRQPGTYGGHLELSAFAHLTRRNVKVIQPGLVYVIEWDAGAEPSDAPAPSLTSLGLPEVDPSAAIINERERRKLKRNQKRLEEKPAVQTPAPDSDDESTTPQGTVYVAYHDWEHFSSIRNLRGPHAGLPNVHEMSSPDHHDHPPSPPKKPASKGKEPKRTRIQPSLSKPPIVKIDEVTALPSTPSQIPLPPSRSPSPESLPASLPYPMPDSGLPRSYRSPKRSFDESSASSDGSQSAAKRPRSATRAPFANTLSVSGPQTPEDDFEDVDTPDLTASNPGSPSSTSSLSPMSSPSPSPPPEPDRRLTRRERKRLGLPKPRAHSTKVSAGKIVIPGGRFRSKQGTSSGAEEWQKNGTGRLDVRGFRELKI
ncbi:unnamed protein product [Somion occarium]|uniref:OTU domain-containing protein n=1 Tax=Somion occarium TaxID=3059160 RepID=A0ABP1CPV1_9APHY